MIELYNILFSFFQLFNFIKIMCYKCVFQKKKKNKCLKYTNITKKYKIRKIKFKLLIFA